MARQGYTQEIGKRIHKFLKKIDSKLECLGKDTHKIWARKFINSSTFIWSKRNTTNAHKTGVDQLVILSCILMALCMSHKKHKTILVMEVFDI